MMEVCERRLPISLVSMSGVFLMTLPAQMTTAIHATRPKQTRAAKILRRMCFLFLGSFFLFCLSFLAALCSMEATLLLVRGLAWLSAISEERVESL